MAQSLAAASSSEQHVVLRGKYHHKRDEEWLAILQLRDRISFERGHCRCFGLYAAAFFLSQLVWLAQLKIDAKGGKVPLNFAGCRG